jgi:hypothetical protein
MDLNNSSHHVRFWKGNMVEIAAAQKWIGQIFFGI